ncbi:hypothetical protein HMI56_001627 [Coelomomyces lativittatus]|nr:hypothetical protein HMI56_001627 [Coelomomyces lativittatus]
MISPSPHYTEKHSSRLTSIHFSDPTLSPIERIILSSSGTLQRTLSAFYNLPIDLDLIYNDITYDETKERWTVSRKIHLLCSSQIICVAITCLTITQKEHFEKLVTEGIGLGQFFKLIHVSPTFQLYSVEKSDQRLFRHYELGCPGVLARIHETYPPWIGAFDAPTRILHHQLKGLTHEG